MIIFIFQTIFQFEVQQKCFQEALLRFAQFFVSPLLKEDSTDRELEAVDSGENLTDFYNVLIWTRLRDSLFFLVLLQTVNQFEARMGLEPVTVWPTSIVVCQLSYF